jgi:hypothetical protein
MRGPAGGGLDRVLAVGTTVADAAGGSEREQRFVLAPQGRQLREEALVASGGPVDRCVHRPRGRETVIATEAA